MQKKWMVFSFALALIFALVFNLITGPKRMDKAEKAFSNQRIEHYTSQYFRFMDTVQIDTADDQMSVFVSFIPEVGSFPIKQEIYESVASHALQITKFFPEATRFEYTVLWDDFTKEEVMHLIMDEEAVNHLETIYYDELRQQRNGLDTSFERVFSSIKETEESRGWHDGPYPGA